MKTNLRDYDESRIFQKTSTGEDKLDKLTNVKKTAKITIDLNKMVLFIKNIFMCVLLYKLIVLINIMIKSGS